VFADLDLPCADGRLLKAQIAVQIRCFIEDKGWTQSEAAEAIGLGRTEVSDLLCGRLAGYSCGRLLNVLKQLYLRSSTVFCIGSGRDNMI